MTKIPSFFKNKWDTKGVPTISWESIQKAPKIDVRLAKSAFLAVADSLNNLEIKFWLNSGTALGAIRDKGLIEYDIDIDLTIFAKDYDIDKLRSEFVNKGFKCVVKKYPALHRNKISGIVVYAYGTQVDIDLNYYYPPDDIIVILWVKPHNHGTIQPAVWYRGDHFIDFLEIKARIPYPPEAFLKLHYGRDWRIPCSDWSWMDIREPISIEKYLNYFYKHEDRSI